MYIPCFLIISLFFISLLTVSAQEHISGSSLSSSISRSIIQGRDFEKIRDLPRRSREQVIAKKVAYLELNFWFSLGNCSGFLVSPKHLLTNQHCIFANGESIEPDGIHVYMDYVNDNNKGQLTSQGKEIVASNAFLDYALVELVDPIGWQFGWLELTPDFHAEQVTIIQHPQGRSKEITRINGLITKINSHKVHYQSDTEMGSSGSPVFKLGTNKVIAIHHYGDPNSQYNEGILISQILPGIKQWLPNRTVQIQPSNISPIVQIIEQF